MRRRSLVPLIALATSLSAAQIPEGPSKLPIDVPRDATVNFDADAPGRDMLPLIKQLLGAGFFDADGGRSESIVVKTGFGDLELRPKDVADLLRPVRELHVVSYVLPKQAEDPIRRHEGLFVAEGMRRVANEGGFLLMRHSGNRYAAVLRQKDNVTVLRVDGMPDLGVATNVILRNIATAAQHGALGKHGGS